jgi:hypothetical protein
LSDVAVLVAVAIEVAACSADMTEQLDSEPGPVLTLNSGLTLHCRGVDEDTCRMIGEAAEDGLPAGQSPARAYLAPAQLCFGEAPCARIPPDCDVYASVVFDPDGSDSVVINVIRIDESVDTTQWDGPTELGQAPIQDDVGFPCQSSPGVP